MRQRAVPSYGGGAAFLFEVGTQLMPAGIEDELFQLRTSGYLPVMAHPERYVPVQRDLDVAARIGRHAALMIDLGALDGAHGKQEMKTARESTRTPSRLSSSAPDKSTMPPMCAPSKLTSPSAFKRRPTTCCSRNI